MSLLKSTLLPPPLSPILTPKSLAVLLVSKRLQWILWTDKGSLGTAAAIFTLISFRLVASAARHGLLGAVDGQLAEAVREVSKSGSFSRRAAEITHCG